MKGNCLSIFKEYSQTNNNQSVSPLLESIPYWSNQGQNQIQSLLFDNVTFRKSNGFRVSGKINSNIRSDALYAKNVACKDYWKL